MRAIDAQHYWLSARFERREGWDPGRYPFNLPVLRGLDELEFHPKVTFLVGENGSGKSTLIEALAVAWGFNPEGGGKNFSFGTRTSHSDLHRFVRPVRGVRRPKDGYFLRAESYFNVATEIEALDREPWGGPPIIDSYGGVSCTSSLTANPSSPCSSTACTAAASTSSMSPRPPCRRAVSSAFWPGCTN